MANIWIGLCSILALVSASSGSIVRDDQTELLVSDCLCSKWEAWIKCFDANDDRVVALDDLKQTSDEFIHLHELIDGEKDDVEEQFNKWWTTILLWNGNKITPDDFVATQANAFMHDRHGFVNRMQVGEEFFNNILDTDNDGFISEKEESIFLVAVGQTDDKKNHDFFEGFTPEEKGEPIEEMTSIWVDYLTNEECSEIENVIRYLDQKD